MASKHRYCPSWLYDCVVADVCIQFMKDRRDLGALANNYAMNLSQHYMEMSTEELARSSEEVIQFLIHIGGSNSEDLLSSFSFFRFYFITKTQRRSFKGVLSWGVLSETKRSYTGVFTLKRLKAYYYEQRSGTNQIGCLGWSLENQPEVEFLRAIAKR